jgi:thioredoxin reductase
MIDSKTDTLRTLASLPCSLPNTAIPPKCDPQEVGDSFAKHLPVLSEEHLTEACIWRDSFALSGTLRTFYSSRVVALAWKKLCAAKSAGRFSDSATKARIVRLPRGSCWVEGFYDFHTVSAPESVCTLVVALTLTEDGRWKAWMFGTILNKFVNSANPDSLRPALATSSQDENSEYIQHGYLEFPFGCVVVGAGQAGLSVAGRLKALDVSHVVLDKHARVGDSWKLRYDSARLHTTRQYAHLPFDRTFPSTCQEYLTKDDLATGHQAWVDRYGITVWNSTSLINGVWDASSKLWTLTIHRDNKKATIVSQSVVLATGAGGSKSALPKVPNQNIYKGQTLHSADFQSAHPWKGRAGIVVGTANTGHDVAKDMFEARCSSVTMIQRSPTYILPAEYYKKVLDARYNDDVPTAAADLSGSWAPIAVTRLMSMEFLNSQAEQQPERFDALEKAGFLTERYGDIIHHLYERNGGHYMDVGTSAMIAQGKVCLPHLSHSCLIHMISLVSC